MRINRGLLGWGLFFLVLGAVPLAVRQGLVGEEVVSRAWTLWPVLLILWGVGLLLRRTPIEAIADLAVAVVFGLIVGGVVAGGGVPFADCGDERGSQPFAARSGELGERAEVDIELNCGELTVAAGPGSEWRIEGADEDGDGPRIDASAGRLEVDSSTGPNVLDARDRWTVALPTPERARSARPGQRRRGTPRVERAHPRAVAGRRQRRRAGARPRRRVGDP